MTASAYDHAKRLKENRHDDDEKKITQFRRLRVSC